MLLHATPALSFDANDGQSTRVVMYAKIHYSPPKGGAFAPPLPPLNPPLILKFTELHTLTQAAILTCSWRDDEGNNGVSPYMTCVCVCVGGGGGGGGG